MTTQQETHDLATLRYSLTLARMLRRIAEPILEPRHRLSFDRMTNKHVDEAAKMIRRLIFRGPGNAD